MIFDIGPILRRLLLGASPLVAGACDLTMCGKFTSEMPFDLTVSALEDGTFTVASSSIGPTAQPDGGAGDPGGQGGMVFSRELREAYERCAGSPSTACGDFCQQFAAQRLHDPMVRSCDAADGTAGRPMVRIAGVHLVTTSCGRRSPAVRLVGGSRAADEKANPVGTYLAACAMLEAESVDAFDLVARELEGCGAPGALVAAATASAADEVRHTRAMDGLAARHGQRRPALRLGAIRPRALVDLARDNAAEGCVRETYGAVVAHLQARTAADPVVRAVMAGIAEDETRHASLAWSIHGWATTRLDRTGRRAVAAARAAAAAELRAAVARPVDPALVHVLGLPDAPTATGFVDELARTLLC